METTKKLTEKGISTTQIGKENYTTFSPIHRSNQTFYQYDYRTKEGQLFSCVAPTLEQCRNKRDKWLNECVMY